MISPDEYLERVVAGIHSVTSTGAEVTWNESINGRQFDVVVRFSLGTLAYLVLIEVKNRTRKASASDLEAFVLKSRDQLANKAVFVTSAGFQSGAMDVAKRHGVDLFTVTLDEEHLGLSNRMSFLTITRTQSPAEATQWSVGEPTEVNQIEGIKLIYVDGRKFDLPDEQSQATYYAKRSYLSDGRSLDQLIQAAPIPRTAVAQTQVLSIAVDDLRIRPPDDYFFPEGLIKAIELTVTARMGRLIRGNIRFEPTMFAPLVIYTNVLTGHTQKFPPHSLPLGMSRVDVGRFYFIVHPLIYYYCDAIEGDLVTWTIVESFQDGNLFQATFTQRADYVRSYIPVTDKQTIDRLNRRLKHLRRERG